MNNTNVVSGFQDFSLFDGPRELTLVEIENVYGGWGPIIYWGIAAAIGFGVGLFGSWSSGRRHLP